MSSEQAGGPDVAAEVRRVDRLAAQRLVEPLGLGQREAVREQASGDAHEPVLVGHAGVQSPEAVVDDPGVVERQGREAVDRVPARLAAGGRSSGSASGATSAM